MKNGGGGGWGRGKKGEEGEGGLKLVVRRDSLLVSLFLHQPVPHYPWENLHETVQFVVAGPIAYNLSQQLRPSDNSKSSC